MHDLTPGSQRRRNLMHDYMIAALGEQADHIWFTENSDTGVTDAEMRWVETLWNTFPDVMYGVPGYASF